MPLVRPVLGLSLLVAACEASTPPSRAPGPLPEEWGKVTFWSAQGVATTWESCTDDPAWRAMVDEPEVDGDGDYVLYRVAADGQSATAQTCTTTASDTCVDSSTGLVWSVASHSLTATPPALVAEPNGTACEVRFDQAWILDDQGPAATWTVNVTLALQGGDPGACDALEASIRAASPNGLGIDGCLVRFIYTLVWFQAA